jgi:hypothetical protein
MKKANTKTVHPISILGARRTKNNNYSCCEIAGFG